MSSQSLAEPNRVPASRVFVALLIRDLHVARREIISSLVRTTMQPLMFIVVFGYLLPRMGFVQRGYGAALLPGILAISLTLSSVQSVAMPMVGDLGWTREIEDRLLAPISIRLVAFEKVVSGVLQGIVTAIFVLPVARLIMGPIPDLDLTNVVELAAVTVLGATVFSMLGLVLGTIIQPAQIGLMFSVIVAPMIMFGCAYYPWSGLSVAPALQYAVLANPLVFVAEGMRAALTPQLPHMNLWAVLGALALLSGVFWSIGIRSFVKRAVG